MTSDSRPTILAAAHDKHRAGDIDGAASLYRDILAHAPQHPDALHMLGVIAHQKGNAALALSLIESSLALAPDVALAWHNRAVALKSRGRIHAAYESALHALSLDAQLADAWDNAGLLLMEKGEYAQGLAHLRHALSLQPENPNYTANYAAALLATGAVREAYACARKLDTVGNAAHAAVLGNIYKAAGYPAKAIPYFERAMTALPNMAALRVNAASAYLQMGAWEKGWPLWEQRPEGDNPAPHLPLWQGKKIDHIVLYEDQGLGDALQMVRYVHLLRDRAHKITLHAHPALTRLFAANFPTITIAQDVTNIKADARARLMSLPALCGTTPENIPMAKPYLHADADLRQKWRTRLQDRPRPWVGLVWEGNKENRKDSVRSIPFVQLENFCTHFARHIVSLQKGGSAELSTHGLHEIYDAAPALNDFHDTAALMAELDLVISVDTAPAHLAAALGRPTWMLTYFDPDFRWLLGRADTPWYPTMRLYRQHAPMQWDNVITALTSDMEKLVGGDTSVLTPPLTHPPLTHPHPIHQDPYALDLDDKG